jgi:hypothetical protein
VLKNLERLWWFVFIGVLLMALGAFCAIWLLWAVSGGDCGSRVYKAGNYLGIQYVIDEHDCGATTAAQTRVILKRPVTWLPWDLPLLTHEEAVLRFEEWPDKDTIRLEWQSPKALVIHIQHKKPRIWQQEPQWQDVTISLKRDLPLVKDSATEAAQQ